jgi:hypothetical protein
MNSNKGPFAGTSKSSERFFNCSLILAYAALNIFGVLHHEPWRDEAQPWLIVRDLDFIGIYRQLGYEGMPGLWHLVMFPFVKSGLPFDYIGFVHLLISIPAAAVFIIYAPFSRYMKALFVFSYYMSFEYSVIARNYSLTPFLLFLIASAYQRRFRFPAVYALLVALLFHTNVHSMVLALTLALSFAFEYRKEKPVMSLSYALPVALMVAGGALSYLIVRTPSDHSHAGWFLKFSPGNFFEALNDAFFPSMRVFMPLALFVFGAGLYALSKHRVVFWNLLASFSWLAYIVVFRKSGALRHYGLILVIFLFGLWISQSYEQAIDEKREKYRKLAFRLLAIALAASVAKTAYTYYEDYGKDFSTAKRMAGYIAGNNLLDRTVLAHRSPPAVSVLPYLPGVEKLWDADVQDFRSFIVWNVPDEQFKMGMEAAVSRMKDRFTSDDRILVLLSSPLMEPERHGLELLYKTEGAFGHGRENFYLYAPIRGSSRDSFVWVGPDVHKRNFPVTAANSPGVASRFNV